MADQSVGSISELTLEEDSKNIKIIEFDGLPFNRQKDIYVNSYGSNYDITYRVWKAGKIVSEDNYIRNKRIVIRDDDMSVEFFITPKKNFFGEAPRLLITESYFNGLNTVTLNRYYDVNVINTNDAPSSLSLSDNLIEDLDAPFIAQFIAYDPDGDSLLSFHMLDDPTGKFSIGFNRLQLDRDTDFRALIENPAVKIKENGDASIPLTILVSDGVDARAHTVTVDVARPAFNDDSIAVSLTNPTLTEFDSHVFSQLEISTSPDIQNLQLEIIGPAQDILEISKLGIHYNGALDFEALSAFDGVEQLENGDLNIVFEILITDGVSTMTQTHAVRITAPKAIDINGSADDDLLSGHPHGGAIYGMGGDDTIVADATTTYVDAGEGDDHVLFAPETANARTRLLGNSGFDEVSFDNVDFEVLFDGKKNSAYTRDGGSLDAGEWLFLGEISEFEIISGSPKDDRLYGNAQTKEIRGQNGNDKIIGGANSDLLFGEDGNDVLSGGLGLDVLYGGNGDDRLLSLVDHDILIGGEGNDIYEVIGSGTVIIEDELGGGRDRANIYGDFAAPAGLEFIVGKWAETGLNISGNDQSDRITGSNLISEGDWILGNDGNDRLVGLVGNDVIEGGSGDDRLYGNSGADVLWGNQGKDVISGGWGQDVILHGVGDGLDYIVDFNLEEDTLDLTRHEIGTKSDLLNAITVIESGLRITLSPDDEIILRGIPSVSAQLLDHILI